VVSHDCQRSPWLLRDQTRDQDATGRSRTGQERCDAYANLSVDTGARNGF